MTTLKFFLLNSILLLTLSIQSKVVRIEINSADTVTFINNNGETGNYQILKGIIYFEVDPFNLVNQHIVDLELAPGNKDGNVEFSTEFELHKPLEKSYGNNRLIYFVNNRGSKIGTWHFNHNTEGNWLYREGYSYLWCGWNCDVIEGENRFNINVPIATNNGSEITGQVYSELISYHSDTIFSLPIVWGGSNAYSPISLDNKEARLTKRKYRLEEAIEISNKEWGFARFVDDSVTPDPGMIYIKEGFIPGWLYDLTYEAKNPKVTGLGMAAIRDLVSFFKYEMQDVSGNSNPLFGNVEYAFAWGHSQSGRLLNHFVHQNFNEDENNRMVFDGIMLNCPGAGKGLFNSRFAQFTRHGSHHEDNLYPIDIFPFATVPQKDLLTNKKADAFAIAKERGTMPKMMFINSSTDYWTRAASLLHTDVIGKNDIEVDKNCRIYAVSGLAHTDSRIGIVGRALLTALNDWITLGVEPPENQVPQISDGTLVCMEEVRESFPEFLDIGFPPSFYQPFQLDMGDRWETDGIADNVPPIVKGSYVCLVPRVDSLGNEIAGIRFPEIAVPLATYTGWSLRNPSFSNTLRRNAGRSYPLAIFEEEKLNSNDQRAHIHELYPTKQDYLEKLSNHLNELKSKRILLNEDYNRLFLEGVSQEFWDEEISNTKIHNIKVIPENLRAGDSVLLQVHLSNTNKVLFVRSSFREANHFDHYLNDSGKNGDIKSNDNIWSILVKIPEDVPAGAFHFDFSCYDINYKKLVLQNNVDHMPSCIFNVID